tara:strand:+ start:490 stop:756 length:267 start_codon:yes stop_codon:yes gene_type:complete
MKITNSEYNTIIRALGAYSNIMKYGASSEDHWAKKDEADTLREKLKKEYDEIAERNIAEGMTAEEEELYPSRLHAEYGGNSIGYKEVE